MAFVFCRAYDSHVNISQSKMDGKYNIFQLANVFRDRSDTLKWLADLGSYPHLASVRNTKKSIRWRKILGFNDVMCLSEHVC